MLREISRKFLISKILLEISVGGHVCVSFCCVSNVLRFDRIFNVLKKVRDNSVSATSARAIFAKENHKKLSVEGGTSNAEKSEAIFVNYRRN